MTSVLTITDLLARLCVGGAGVALGLVNVDTLLVHLNTVIRY